MRVSFNLVYTWHTCSPKFYLKLMLAQYAVGCTSLHKNKNAGVHAFPKNMQKYPLSLSVKNLTFLQYVHLRKT